MDPDGRYVVVHASGLRIQVFAEFGMLDAARVYLEEHCHQEMTRRTMMGHLHSDRDGTPAHLHCYFATEAGTEMVFTVFRASDVADPNELAEYQPEMIG